VHRRDGGALAAPTLRQQPSGLARRLGRRGGFSSPLQLSGGRMLAFTIGGSRPIASTVPAARSPLGPRAGGRLFVQDRELSSPRHLHRVRRQTSGPSAAGPLHADHRSARKAIIATQCSFHETRGALGESPAQGATSPSSRPRSEAAAAASWAGPATLQKRGGVVQVVVGARTWPGLVPMVLAFGWAADGPTRNQWARRELGQVRRW
jgi:hypothetical protein